MTDSLKTQNHHTAPIYVLAGPTASGKSALALLIAKKQPVVIINADSKQVYKEIPLITAQPSTHEQQQAPHLLYGHISAQQHYSVADWVADATTAIEQTLDEGKIPFLVGGTGMYLKSLIHGMSNVPETQAKTRKDVRNRWEASNTPAMHAHLASIDPASAEKLSPNDTQRILRAIEVMEQTGKSICEWQKQRTTPTFEASRYKMAFLDYPREQVYSNCNTRFEKMMEEGVLDEIKAFDALGLDETLPAMKAHGVPELRSYLNGTMTRENALEQSKRHTRNYIKRQYTWFYHQMPEMKRCQTSVLALNSFEKTHHEI